MTRFLSVRLLNNLVLLSSLFFTANSFADDDGTWTYGIGEIMPPFLVI
jgi:hypothetical protein